MVTIVTRLVVEVEKFDEVDKPRRDDSRVYSPSSLFVEYDMGQV